LVDQLVAAHLKVHGDDAQRSLAAVAHHSTLGDLAQSVADPDMQASLAAAGATLDTTADERRAEDGLRYRVVRPHAQGGLGVVSVARDAELGREVAFKEIQARYAEDATQRGRFVREAEITGGLEHPGIVPVYGLGRYADGRPYYAMRFIRGESLQEATRKLHAGEAGRTLRDLLTRFVAVCNAVAYAHSRGVIHRDLKPANVMLGPYGETLVVDWGLAKVVGREPADDESLAEETLRPPSGEDSLTQAGAHLGTPAFMSPEQARGEVTALGPSTDVYSLGATLYAVLTGRPPVQGRDTAEVLERVRQGNWPSARKVKRSVPRALDAICGKAMALEAADRYGTALELAADVEHWLADDPVSAWREPWPTRAGRWVRRHRTKVAAGVAASFVALLLGGAGLMWQQRVQALQRQEQDRRRAAAEAALERVSDFQVRGNWAEARTALEQAKDRLSGTTSAELQQRVADARRNLELVAELDDIRQKSLNGFAETIGVVDPEATDRLYEGAFEGARMGTPGTEPEAVAKRVKESPVREALVATLDDWARVASGSRRAWALAVARRADPNSWRDRLRDPTVWEDGKLLAKLASEAPVEELRPGLAAAIGDKLSAAGEGVELLRAAQARWPSDFWINYYLASALHRKGRLAESEGFHRAALAVRPDIAATYYNLAAVLESQGQKDEAYKLFLRALECYPKPPGITPDVSWAWAIGKFGSVWERLGKLDDAAALCRKAIESNPQAAIGYTSLGWALERQGKREEATSWYRKAHDDHPEDASVRAILAGALQRQGKPEEVVAMYKRLLDTKFGENFRTGLVMELEHLGMREEATALYRKTVDANPSDMSTLYSLAGLLERQGKLEEAAAVYRKAFDANPKDRAPFYQLTRLLERQGKLEEAAAVYRKALEADPTDINMLQGLTRLLENQGKVEELVALYRKAHDANPKDPLALQRLTLWLDWQGKQEEAAAVCRRALDADPSDAKTLRVLAGLLERQGKVDEAVARFRNAVDANPKDQSARNGLAGLLERQGKVEDAVALYRKPLDANPRDPTVLIGLAGLLERQGKVEEAIALYRKALDVNPGVPVVLHGLAILLEQQGEQEEAAAVYRKLLDVNPRDSYTVQVLAGLLERQGKVDEAVALFRKALDTDPKDTFALNGLAGLLDRQGKQNEAVVLYRKAIEADPKDAYTLQVLAGWLDRQGKAEEAETLYRKALEADPTDANILQVLAGLLERQAKLEEAAALYRKALDVNPKDRSARNGLAGLLERQGKVNEAEALYRKALNPNPGDWLARNGLAGLLERQGKADEAAALYRKALDANPRDANTLQVLSGLLERQGKLEEAAALYRKALDANPKDWSARYGLAGLLERQGKVDEAVALFRKAVDENPRDANTLKVLAGLLERQGKLEEAAALYRQVAELNRISHFPLSNDLTRVLLALGNYQQATHAAQSVRPLAHLNSPVRAECDSFQRQALLGARLPEVLGGKYRPANATEGLDFAELCWLQGHYRDAVRLTADAFTTDPKLANDLTTSYRYKAACQAASAGCKKGHGTTKLSEDESARIRGQALKWLRADLDVCRELARSWMHWPEVVTGLQSWRASEDLYGVREVTGLARLPDAERREWETFWADVKAVLTNPPTK
jgi:tetratricopeptide (TPR) repeat protein